MHPIQWFQSLKEGPSGSGTPKSSTPSASSRNVLPPSNNSGSSLPAVIPSSASKSGSSSSGSLSKLFMHKCDQCDYQTKYSSNLKRHKRTHEKQVQESQAGAPSQKRFQCPVCDFQTDYLQNLKFHNFRVHENRKPFACQHCTYECVTQHQLNVHMKQKHNDGSQPLDHACPMCSYQTTKKDSLNKHMLAVHKGEKPFACDKCSYRAAQSSHLISHLRTHSGEKPYQCDFCDYSSTTKSNLKGHIVRIHGLDHLERSASFSNSDLSRRSSRAEKRRASAASTDYIHPYSLPLPEHPGSTSDVLAGVEHMHLVGRDSSSSRVYGKEFGSGSSAALTGLSTTHSQHRPSLVNEPAEMEEEDAQSNASTITDEHMNY